MRQDGFRLVLSSIMLFLSMLLMALNDTYILKVFFFVMSVALLIYIYSLSIYTVNPKVFEDEDITEANAKRKSNYYFNQLDRGVLYFNENNVIIWQNRHSMKLLGRVTKMMIHDVFPQSDNKSNFTFNLDERVFNVTLFMDTHIIEMIDITEIVNLKLELNNNEIVIGYIFVDNLDELLQSDEPSGAETNAKVRKLILDYVSQYNIAIRTIRSDRFICITTAKTFNELIKDKFSLIEFINTDELLGKHALGLTFGFAKGFEVLDVIEEKANMALELAQSRGGSQACVIEEGKQTVFYGGNKEAQAKRSKVRLRLVKRTLVDIIKSSDKVWIMGHRYADLDALAACVGMRYIARFLGKETKILLDQTQLDRATYFGFHDLAGNAISDVITDERLFNKIGPNDVMIVVDVNKPSLVQYPNLLKPETKKIIFDHHRKTDIFMDNVILSHIEPYASSTTELICEILELFDSNNFQIGEDVATLMLAGITVDTSFFRQKTGVRTFEAASYLKRLGASSAKVDQLLKVDFDDFTIKAKIMSLATRHEVYPLIIAPSDETATRATIAAVADQLITLQGIHGSFVIAKDVDKPNIYNISARSEKDINVQVMMEMMNGGGHYSKAATQIESDSLQEVYELLYSTIDTYFEKEE